LSLYETITETTHKNTKLEGKEKGGRELTV